MSARPRHEHQIKLNSHTHNGHNTFKDALWTVLYRRGALDLSGLSDELVGEVRDLMINREWTRHKLNRANRQARAA